MSHISEYELERQKTMQANKLTMQRLFENDSVPEKKRVYRKKQKTVICEPSRRSSRLKNTPQSYNEEQETVAPHKRGQRLRTNKTAAPFMEYPQTSNPVVLGSHNTAFFDRCVAIFADRTMHCVFVGDMLVQDVQSKLCLHLHMEEFVIVPSADFLTVRSCQCAPIIELHEPALLQTRGEPLLPYNSTESWYAVTSNGNFVKAHFRDESKWQPGSEIRIASNQMDLFTIKIPQTISSDFYLRLSSVRQGCVLSFIDIRLSAL